MRDSPGLLRQADGGTVLLDEVGEMSLRMQALLLRFLETGEIQTVGGGAARVVVDVRVIAATNRNLQESTAAREFREDLYYRLNVFHIASRRCAIAGTTSRCCSTTTSTISSGTTPGRR